MNDLGKIQNSKIDELFNDLIVTKHIISMYVVGTDFERLTCVVSTEQENNGKFLQIDKPDGFEKAVQKKELWKIRFSFIGPDRLEYLFHTLDGTVNGTTLKIPYPEFVERLQRRRDFRVSTLWGTKLVFVHEEIKGVISLINLSLGGAFGVLMKHNQKDLKGPLFTKDQPLYKIGIIFPADKDNDERVVIINKAEIRRIEHDIERKLYKYALEFIEIDKTEQQKLTQAIYNIQRQYLKNR